MKTEYKNSANKNGIYKIINNTNQRVYFGSCLRFKSRYKSHFNSLINKKHKNRFLQADFNKCGSENFIFEVVEIIEGSKENRLKKEQEYINLYFDGGKNCYNLRKNVTDTREGKGNTKPTDPLTDGRCKPKTEEQLKKLSESLTETWQQPEYRELSRQNAYENRWKDYSANIIVTNKKTGEKVTIDGSVRQFCIDRNISYKAFNQLINGKIKSSGGWFIGDTLPEYINQKGQIRKPLTKEHRDKIAGNKYSGIILVNSDGEKLIIESNVKEQCKNLNIDYSTLLKVINGKCKSVFGWKLLIN